MQIKLEKVKEQLYHEVINLIRSDSELSEIFAFNCLTRVGFSPITYYILADNKRIGFISLIDEGMSYNIDCGIIKQYRNKKIGTTAMALFLKEIEKFKIRIITETTVDNVAANRMLKKNSFVLIKTKRMINYYEFAEAADIKKLKKNK